MTWAWWWKIKCSTYFYNFHFTYSCLFLFVSLNFHITWKYLIVICLNWNKVSFELLILNLSVESSLYFNCKRVKFKHNLIFDFFFLGWGGALKNVFLFAFQNWLWFWFLIFLIFSSITSLIMFMQCPGLFSTHARSRISLSIRKQARENCCGKFFTFIDSV